MPQNPVFPQHNLESHVISRLWYYTLFATEISYCSQQVGTKAERRDSQDHREGCEGWNSPLLLPTRAPCLTVGQQHCPIAGQREGTYCTVRLSDTTGMGLHDDQSWAPFYNLSTASAYI